MGTTPIQLLGQERPVVVVDAGHGGAEVGVQAGDLAEKDLVLRIAFVVGAEFAERGWDVRFTRTGDYAVSWDDRRAAGEDANADLLLMLHAMGKEDTSVHGAEVYTHPDAPASVAAGRALSQALLDMGSAVLEEPREWPPLQSQTVPTVMIELAHMTHPVERRLLLADAFHHELGAALAEAADRELRR